MSQKMWKIPASLPFVKYISTMGFLDKIPKFEHVYLGKQLTTPQSFAEKVSVDENMFRIMYSIKLENRIFYFEYSKKDWYVLIDRHVM